MNRSLYMAILEERILFSSGIDDIRSNGRGIEAVWLSIVKYGPGDITQATIAIIKKKRTQRFFRSLIPIPTSKINNGIPR